MKLKFVFLILDVVLHVMKMQRRFLHQYCDILKILFLLAYFTFIKKRWALISQLCLSLCMYVCVTAHVYICTEIIYDNKFSKKFQLC